MNAFQSFIEKKLNCKFANYGELHQWSVENPETFWMELSRFVNIRWTTQPTKAHQSVKSGMLGTRWFPDGKLNFAQNLLWKGGSSDAIVSHYEAGLRQTISWSQLRTSVHHLARYLKNHGVRPGDRIAGIVANGIEAIVAMLATSSIGATWASCSPDFGSVGIRDRLNQIAPSVIFVTRRYDYNGKRLVPVDQCHETIKNFDRQPQVVIIDPFDSLNDEFWPLCRGQAAKTDDSEIEISGFDFNHPLYIMFSSGTTGLPKCIIHGAGGTLIQHKKELMLHSDVKENDRLFFFTTCGWMMWNWMASALSVGCTLVTYDGSPAYPDPTRLWQIVHKEKLTHFGTSPKFISASMPHDKSIRSLLEHSSQLRSILSTGAPLLPAHFDWIYNVVHNRDVHLASISGGTDIISCFMLGNPTTPVFPGEIQNPGLGMAVESWNDSCEPVVGQKGELVCTKPFPSMPIGFLNDPNHSKYKKAYFEHYNNLEKYPDVWWHGDFIEITSHGGMIVYGRSDATLNPGGVRIGTAELYRVVESIPEILDSIAISHNIKGDDQVLLFVKLSSEARWSQDLEKIVRQRIRHDLTPRHVPHIILEVSDIPYTRSGKKVELAVTQVMRGESINNKSALANPESLDLFIRLREKI